MGMSAYQGLKLAADAAFARGNVVEGQRLMKEYNNALARIEKEKNERKDAERKKAEREVERKRKKAEEAERKNIVK